MLKDVNAPDWSKQAVFTVAEGGGESLRTDLWRYTQRGFGENGAELYDLQNDPGEFTNQAGNPEYNAQLKMMQAALDKRRREVCYQGAFTREYADKKKKRALRRRRHELIKETQSIRPIANRWIQ